MKLHHPLIFFLSLQINALPSERATNARAAVAAQMNSFYASDRYIIADAMHNTLSGIELNATQTAALDKLSDLGVDTLAEFGSWKMLDDLERVNADIADAKNSGLEIEKRDKQFFWMLLPLLWIFPTTVAGVKKAKKKKYEKEHRNH